ncbi:MAG: hypothetical protein ACPG07_04140 [Henriciella sp.]
MTLRPVPVYPVRPGIRLAGPMLTEGRRKSDALFSPRTSLRGHAILRYAGAAPRSTWSRIIWLQGAARLSQVARPDRKF